MPLNDFKKEVKFIYKDEEYSVRDNGAVFRHARDGKRLRKDDNQWTFGKPNATKGYMEITSVGVHKIVATAFLGERPSSDHVVDHIDTNRRNNRLENLRWVTRLDNILHNPITARKIALVCGSVEAFLANPKAFHFPDPNYAWMQTVTAEQAQRCKENLMAWAEIDKYPSTGKSLDAWIFRKRTIIPPKEEVLAPVDSKSPNAIQMNWKTPSEFPCCPAVITDYPIASYAANLNIAGVFCRNQYSVFIVSDFAISKDGSALWVLCKATEGESVKSWSLARVSLENKLFVHTGLGFFFDQKSAEKAFTLVQGLEWTGGDTFDDLC